MCLAYTPNKYRINKYRLQYKQIHRLLCLAHDKFETKGVILYDSSCLPLPTQGINLGKFIKYENYRNELEIYS